MIGNMYLKKTYHGKIINSIFLDSIITMNSSWHNLVDLHLLWHLISSSKSWNSSHMSHFIAQRVP